MPRRDAFSRLKYSSSQVDRGKSDPGAPPTVSANLEERQPLDLIPTAKPRKKRNRDWEQAHRAETVTYRGIPRECHFWVEEIAGGLAVPRDEVVRAFLEYGEGLYQCGVLRLYPFPKSQRMTLYPDGAKASGQTPSTSSKDIANWLSEAFPLVNRQIAPPKKLKRKEKQEPAWQVRVTYRIPVVLKNRIRTIAAEHSLPVGEVVRFFIEQSLLAFRKGELPLQPVPKWMGKTLFQDRQI